MPDLLLINPNASHATTDMMVGIAQAAMPAGFRVVGVTAGRGPQMIVDESELAAAALDVEHAWHATPGEWAGVIVSAFGDPGMERVRAACPAPVVGICEASMREAAAGGRRFGIATVTPRLSAALAAKAVHYGVGDAYTGIRLTAGDPRLLSQDPAALENALADAVRLCIEQDGAEAVVIGGGPLGQAALGLAARFSQPVIAPIDSAARRLLAQLLQTTG